MCQSSKPLLRADYHSCNRGSWFDFIVCFQSTKKRDNWAQVPSISPFDMHYQGLLYPHSWTQKLKLARQEDISCLNSLGISNFRENLPSLPDSLARLSFWVDYGGSGLGQVDMSGGQMALPISRYWYALVWVVESNLGNKWPTDELFLSVLFVRWQEVNNIFN